MRALTIGMATYDDFDGVYFTLQSLRLFQDLRDTELLVVDNFGCDHTRTFVQGLPDARYVRATDVVGTAAAKGVVFQEARGEAVLCCDSHVLFAPDVISKLKRYYRDNPECSDLLQGPLVYDDLGISTHFDPVWRGQMFGIWATDPRGQDPEGEPFEIPMQGMGAFSCRTSAWPGFNPNFRGFGGEEGYIHEKFRRAGGRCLCLPWFRWMHRFVRPAGVPYPITVEDKLRNYVIGHAELGLDLTPALTHFCESLPEDRVVAVTAEALWGPAAVEPVLAAPPETDAAIERAEYPPVSCICPTYGRPALLEEAVQSFLLQDYPGTKELIVLNDFDQQILSFDHPEVVVVNVPRRFKTLGEKHNAAVALATHDLIFLWDDDDIYLPHRLTFSVERFDDEKGFFKPARALVSVDGRLSGPASNVFAAGSCWSRDMFERVRGYAPVDVAHDVELEARFEEAAPGSTATYDIDPDEIYYIYRWGTGAYNGSGFSENQHDAVAEAVQQQVQGGLLDVGQISLTPRWRRGYVELAREYLAPPQEALPRRPRRGRPLIVDTVTFNDEFDVLECRLTELDEVVDWFVIAEGALTHQGAPKPFYLTEYLERCSKFRYTRGRFERWRDRLVVVQAKNLPTLKESFDSWDREHAQRDALMRGLERLDISDDDIVLHGDLDEIPKPSVLRNLCPTEFTALDMSMYSMAVDWLHPHRWRGTVAARASHVTTFSAMRDLRNVAPHLPEAGWHLTWLGGKARQRAKLAAFAHPEIAPAVCEPIEEDLFLREGWHVDRVKLEPVDVDGTWPKWVAERRCPSEWFRPR